MTTHMIGSFTNHDLFFIRSNTNAAVSHRTFNSVFLISAFSTFVIAFRHRFPRPVAFENEQQPQLCNLPGGDIRRSRRSAQVFQEKRVRFPRRCGQGRTRLALHTSGSERQGTTLRQLWTNEKYASKPFHALLSREMKRVMELL
jgi:hypothetical protein